MFVKFIKYQLHANKPLVWACLFIAGDIFYWEFGNINLYVAFLLLFLFIVNGNLLKICIITFIFGWTLGFVYNSMNFSDINKFYGLNIDADGFIYEYKRNGVSQEIVLKTKTYGKILVRQTEFQNYYLGEWLNLRGKLKEPAETKDFSYKDYLKVQNINYIIENAQVKVAERSSFESKIFVALGRVRNYFISTFRHYLSEPASSLLIGMTIGQDQDLPVDFEQNVRRTGTSHIVAVSGFNVSLVIGWFLGLAKKIGRKSTIYISFVGISIFLLIVGVANQPAMRASLMGGLFLLLQVLGRKVSRVNGLIYVVVVMFLINPLIYKSVSFLLSISAMGGIWIFTPKIESKLKILPSIIRGDVATTISALIGTLPVTLLSFGGVSLIGIVVNAMILPIIAHLTILGFVVVFVNIFSIKLTILFSFVLNFLVQYMINVVNVGGESNFGYISNLKITQLESFIIATIILLFGVISSYFSFLDKLATISTKCYE